MRISLGYAAGAGMTGVEINDISSICLLVIAYMVPILMGLGP
jgi:hypothetical protein